MVVSPRHGSGITSLRPQVSVSYPASTGWGTQIDSRRTVFRVDGRDVTRAAIQRGTSLTWQPKFDFTAGQHTADIVAFDNNGNSKLSERWNFTVNARSTPPLPPASNTSATLTPKSGASVRSLRPRIGAFHQQSNGNRGLEADQTRIRFKVDGRDISNQAKFWSNSVNWTPSFDLSVGQHQVDMVVFAKNGTKLVDDSWNFTVAGTNTTPPTTAKPPVAMPLNGSKMRARRPRIGAKFKGTVDQRTQVDAQRIRFKVDGQDVSQDVSVSRSEIFFIPTKSLGIGRHTADLLAFDVSGKKIFDRGWGFTITSAQATTPPATSAQGLATTNIQNGMVLGSRFMVNGTGVPGSQVVVTVQHPKKDILSQLAGVMLSFRGQATVANDGTYSVPLDAGNVRRGEPMTITITDSVQSPTVTMRTKRGQNNQAQPQMPGSSATPPSTTTTSPKISFTVLPTNRSSSNNRRPRVGSTFSHRVSRAKLVIDGRDFTNQARFNGTGIFWDAPHDLDFMRHSATATGWVNGRAQATSWTFDITQPKGTINRTTQVTMAVSPRDGLTSTNLRPMIGSTFSQKMDRAKLLVDGRDFTKQAKFDGNQIFWTPSYNLDRAPHTAKVTGWVNGAAQTKSWSFTLK